MASTSKLISIVLKLDDQLSGSLNKTASSLKSFGNNVTDVGKGLTTLTAPIIAAGVAGVKMAMDLDKAMRNVQSITGQTNEEIAAFSDRLVEMSTDISKTVDSAEQLAEGLYAINSAGFLGEEGMKVLEVATKAATAGLTETTRAAEGIDAVLNAYNLTAADAAHVSDLMFTTVQRGVGTFDELTSSMSNVVGTANAAGVGFEQVSAAMTTMSKSGMSFSEASVSLNQVMLAFIKPSSEMTKVLNDMGYATGQAAIDALGFDGALQAVSEHVGNSAEGMSKLFGNVRGLRGALALTGSNAQKFSEDLMAMADATGATNEAFAAQTQSFEAQFKNFSNIMGALLIEIGQTLLPIINDILKNFVIPLIQAFRGLPEPVKTIIVVIGMLVAVLGPLLILFGSIVSAIGAIAPAVAAIGAAIGGVSAALPALGAVLAGISAPVAILIAALVALGFALNALFNDPTWQQNAANFGKIIELLVQKVTTWVANLVKNIGQGFQQIPGLIQQAISFFANLGSQIQKVLGAIANLVKGIAVNIIQGLIDGIKSKIQEWFNTIKSLADGAVGIVKKALGIASPSKVMMDFGQQVVAGFNKGVDAMGGLAIPPPTLAGASLGSSMASPTVMPNASAAGGANGGDFIMNGDIIVPPGTTEEQIRFIMRAIGKEVKRRGGGL